MSRAQFDSQQVVQNAMQLFWQQGYSGASMQDVTAATGLKPGSIYLAFTNKDGLYKASLQRYAQQTIEFIESTIAQAPNVKKGICNILNIMINESIETQFYSCFLVRSRMELPQSSALHQFTGELLTELENCFAKQLSTQYEQALADQYAGVLMIQIFGIRVYGYHQNSGEKLRAAIQTSLPWLDWET